MPLLVEKFKRNLQRRFTEPQQKRILDVSLDPQRLDSIAVNDYVDLYIP
jgi:2-methylcitrate dehydratase